MVTLSPMQPARFAAYVERGIREYAQEHIKNGDWTPHEALERSRKEFEQLLPDGLKSKDQHIFTIMDPQDGRDVGILWVHVKTDAPPRRAFIYDFIIEEEYRGKGYGKQALAALDETLQSMNVQSVALHVFAHNTNAIELYKKMGFETTDLHMRKQYLKS
ncbi:MAG TPA: GNAT family N-acetyltransferase [Anaerolineales bacterium]|jgi:ribosomal protein S18 acetylase RimI-like enzyme